MNLAQVKTVPESMIPTIASRAGCRPLLVALHMQASVRHKPFLGQTDGQIPYFMPFLCHNSRGIVELRFSATVPRLPVKGMRCAHSVFGGLLCQVQEDEVPAAGRRGPNGGVGHFGPGPCGCA